MEVSEFRRLSLLFFFQLLMPDFSLYLFYHPFFSPFYCFFILLPIIKATISTAFPYRSPLPSFSLLFLHFFYSLCLFRANFSPYLVPSMSSYFFSDINAYIFVVFSAIASYLHLILIVSSCCLSFHPLVYLSFSCTSFPGAS